MESRVSTVTIDVRLVPERHEVVDVTHLMVCRDKPVLRYLCALMDPENKNITKLFKIIFYSNNNWSMGASTISSPPLKNYATSRDL